MKETSTMSYQRLSAFLGATLLSLALFAPPAHATVVAKFLVTVDSAADRTKVAETLAHLSLANCKMGQAVGFGLSEIVAWMECNEGPDATKAILEDVAKVAGVTSISVFSLGSRS